MLKLASIVIISLGISSAQAAEPFRMVLTDVEQNIYKETFNITNSDVTPDCPASWSVRKYVLHGGQQEGVEVVEVNNGRLSLTIVPTRGMSIQQVLMDDLRLGWDSPVKGLVHPKYINLNMRRGLGWLEGFNEYMVRCGLEFFGGPGTDEFIDNTGKKAKMYLTLHGRIGNTPASQVEVVIERQKPYSIRVRGRVDEASMHGPKLELWTEVMTVPGSSTFRISDKVTNRSSVEQEFGILYHSNYGAPLMEKDAQFVAPVREVAPINEHSASDISTYNIYRAPMDGFAEQVYCLQLWADENDRTKVMLRNAASDKAVSMAFSVGQLPYFTLWKNPVAYEDGYVTGLEPGTGFPHNRSIERVFGRVPKLASHQSRLFAIDFTLHLGKEQVDAVAGEILDIQAGRETKVDVDPLPTEKVSLADIAKAARTWKPSYVSWYGKEAPDFTLSDLNGKEHKLSDYRGRNVIIVFWTTWCGPCRKEVPSLIELRNTVDEKDLAILAISNEKLDLVQRVASQLGMNYTILLDKDNMPDPFGVMKIFRTTGIPCSFFIDPQGKIKLATSGLVSLREIRAILKTE
jgi:peroxiredoxin